MSSRSGWAAGRSSSSPRALRRRSGESAAAMGMLPIRLATGTDPRLGPEQVLEEQREQAGWVLSGIGSLSVAPLRLAGQEELTTLKGNLEILILAGSLSPDGAHPWWKVEAW